MLSLTLTKVLFLSKPNLTRTLDSKLGQRFVSLALYMPSILLNHLLATRFPFPLINVALHSKKKVILQHNYYLITFATKTELQIHFSCIKTLFLGDKIAQKSHSHRVKNYDFLAVRQGCQPLRHSAALALAP